MIDTFNVVLGELEKNWVPLGAAVVSLGAALAAGAS